MLLEICGPEAAARLAQPSGETPLHYIVRGATCKKRPQGAGEAAVRVLLEARPQSASLRSSPEFESRTPLHLACALMAPIPIITMLRHTEPEGLWSVRDGRGWTALDIAKKHSFLRHPLWRWRVGSVLVYNDNGGVSDAGRRPAIFLVDNTPPLLNHTQQHERASAAAAPAEVFFTPPVGGESGNREKDDLLCVVCWDGQADYALIPCGHICLCKECSNTHGYSSAWQMPRVQTQCQASNENILGGCAEPRILRPVSYREIRSCLPESDGHS